MRYNCIIIDLHDRGVVASEIGKWITSDFALGSGKSVHFSFLYSFLSGIRYHAKHEYGSGCPYDNAPMERYYNTFKAELINRFHFNNDEELDHAVSEYVYNWYNQVRPHSYNGYQTPYEARFGLGN